MAFALGASGRAGTGDDLYRAVRERTGAAGDSFRPETKVPRLSADNPPQNWRASDLDQLWTSPIVGSTGTTVGQAVAEALEPGNELPRRLEPLGDGIADSLRLPPVPGLRRWLGRQAGRAYQRGFVAGLTADPKEAVSASAGQLHSQAAAAATA